MTKTNPKTTETPADKPTESAFVVFGVDADKKPRAARLGIRGSKHVMVVISSAHLLQLLQLKLSRCGRTTVSAARSISGLDSRNCWPSSES